MKVVASLTTLPGRENILLKTLESLVTQTRPPQIIYLTLPKISRRLQIPYEKPSEQIKRWCTIVEPEVDYGPITKIYGGLMMESDPETVIISCDDDVIYPPKTFEVLLEKSAQNPEACICGSGMLVQRGMYFNSSYVNMDKFQHLNGLFGFLPTKEGRKVDLIFGVSGVLYRRKFFSENPIKDLFEVALTDNDILCNDDVLISGYLQSRKVPRLTFPDIPTINLLDGDDPTIALSAGGLETLPRMNRAIQKLRDQGYFTYFESVGFEETVTGNSIVLAIWVIILILLIIVMFLTLYNPISREKLNSIIYI